jgi:hypothetical protein
VVWMSSVKDKKQETKKNTSRTKSNGWRGTDEVKKRKKKRSW